MLPRLVWLYLRFILLTSRVSIHGSEYPDQLTARGQGFIYAFWHNRQILLPVVRDKESIHCLISSSADGEYIARVASLFGKTAIRGSSTRGGYEAMKQMIRVLRSNGIVAITPDGPLGPVYSVNPGAVQISRAANVPVVPVAYDASRKKVFASWDGFNLPYPFGTIAVVFGKPLIFDPAQDIEQACTQLKRALDDVLDQAREHIE